MTKVSTSITLVWQLAGREAIAGMFPVVEPEHFLIALLKLVEIPPGQVAKLCQQEEGVAEEVTRETQEILSALQAMGVDSTASRRQLRTLVGRGNTAYDGGELHRSEASRKMFEEAVRLADAEGGDVLKLIHLLTAMTTDPTCAMRAIFGTHAGMSPCAGGLADVIAEEGGVDLTALAAKGEIAAVRGRVAEARALLKLLLAREKKGAFLVCASPGAAAEVMVTLACLALKDEGEGVRLRVVDFACKPRRSRPGAAGGREQRSSHEMVQGIQRMLAAGRPNVVARIPDGVDARESEAVLWTLKATAGDKMPVWIWRACPPMFKDGIESDMHWRRNAGVILVAETVRDGIPDAL